MASTLTKILLHVTFSTKGRAPMIPEHVEPDLYAYVGGICRRMKSPMIAIGGVADHVHLLVSLSKNVALADLMLNIKRDTSKWIKTQDPSCRRFDWQDGYFAFSIGESGVEATTSYIAGQKKRHARMDYKDEMRAILQKYKMTWDESYVWE